MLTPTTSTITIDPTTAVTLPMPAWTVPNCKQCERIRELETRLARYEQKVVALKIEEQVSAVTTRHWKERAEAAEDELKINDSTKHLSRQQLWAKIVDLESKLEKAKPHTLADCIEAVGLAVATSKRPIHITSSGICSDMWTHLSVSEAAAMLGEKEVAK